MRDSLLSILRMKYKKGTRINLIRMDDPQAPPKDTQGTVTGVDDAGHILVNWDNGSGLNVVLGEDVVELVMCEEMIKLRKWLDDKKIEWIDYSDSTIMPPDEMMLLSEVHRTRFTINGVEFSVINGYGTYGGSGVLDANEGLLEMKCGNEDDVRGWLTAKDIEEYIIRSGLLKDRYNEYKEV